MKIHAKIAKFAKIAKNEIGGKYFGGQICHVRGVGGSLLEQQKNSNSLQKARKLTRPV